MILALATIAAAGYAAAALLIWRTERPGLAEQGLALLAAACHAWALSLQVFQEGSIAIGINEALSLFAWQTAALLWSICWREPLRILGVGVYPLAAISALCAALWPTATIAVGDWKMLSHIVLGLLAVGLLTLATVQAVLLAMQERLLHRHEQTRLLRALPPLLTMERLLFQLVALGAFMLALVLLSGMSFVYDFRAQHLLHKTVLSAGALLIFGVLLWGRYRYGWRGKKAFRWALSGYATLILAYFGSKLILEQFLGRHWS